MLTHLIVGAGLAGHRAALALRKRTAEDRIVLIGEEDCLPYDRPPLSKDALLGEGTLPPLAQATKYDELKIDFQPGCCIEAVDVAAQRVHPARGEPMAYDRLLLATGSRCRRLPSSLTGDAPILYLRSASDAAAIKAQLRPDARVLIIGGGFIGLEVAAAAKTAGATVHVIEAAPRILARALPAEASDRVAALHTKAGVDLNTRTTIEAMHRESDAIRVTTDKGPLLVDTVIAGVGILPNDGLAREAGIETRDGIIVDEACRTSVETVFAAGEVTRHPSRFARDLVRIESWQVANRQPEVAATTMTGGDAAYTDPPWFWTDQYGQNLQMIGLPDLMERLDIHEGPDPSKWTMIGLDHEACPVMGIAMNNGRHISMLKRELRQRRPLADDFFG